LISVAFLCILFLPGVVLAQTEADLEAEAKADREWGGREKRLEALRQLEERSRKQEQEMNENPGFRVPTYWDTEEGKKYLEDQRKQALKDALETGTSARLRAHMEAMDLANKKPPLTVPLSTDRIIQIRVRAASRSAYDLFLSLKKPLMGVSVLRWHAATLDDAMTIIRSVQEGRVEAANVRTHWPKEDPEPDSKPIKYELEPCKECHVMEWVFRVSGKK
jgi:hypothetical protein